MHDKRIIMDSFVRQLRNASRQHLQVIASCPLSNKFCRKETVVLHFLCFLFSTYWHHCWWVKKKNVSIVCWFKWTKNHWNSASSFHRRTWFHLVQTSASIFRKQAKTWDHGGFILWNSALGLANYLGFIWIYVHFASVHKLKKSRTHDARSEKSGI